MKVRCYAEVHPHDYNIATVMLDKNDGMVSEVVGFYSVNELDRLKILCDDFNECFRKMWH